MNMGKIIDLTRFNKIAIQARAQMAAVKEAVGLSRVHIYESKCILPLRDNCLFCSDWMDDTNYVLIAYMLGWLLH